MSVEDSGTQHPDVQLSLLYLIQILCNVDNDRQ